MASYDCWTPCIIEVCSGVPGLLRGSPSGIFFSKAFMGAARRASLGTNLR